jgi:hypothetical protein
MITQDDILILDPLFAVTQSNPTGVVSGRTALIHYGILDDQLDYFELSFKRGHHKTPTDAPIGSRYRERVVSNELFDLGITTDETMFGNEFKIYNAERALIDLWRSQEVDLGKKITALKKYINEYENRNISRLFDYLDKFKEKEVHDLIISLSVLWG